MIGRMVRIGLCGALLVACSTGQDAADKSPEELCETAYEAGVGNAASQGRESWIAECVAETNGEESTTTEQRTTTTEAPTTTTTIPELQAIEEMGAEIDRACTEAIDSLEDPSIRYDEAWEPYGSRAEVLQRAEECVDARWEALKEEERQREAEARQAEEQRRAEEEAARGTVSQQNAKRKAEQYLNVSAFSRSGLIEQLEFEGFSNADATWGVDALDVDWNDQAAKKAQQYLDVSAFSRQGLIEQLVFEGFTQAQAEYGVSQTGL